MIYQNITKLINKNGKKLFQSSLILVPILLLFSINKTLFLILFFITLDLIINYIKSNFSIPDIPFDPITFGSLTLSYFFGFKTGLLLLPFAVLTQIIYGLIKLRHMFKLCTLSIGIFIATLLSSIPVYYAVPIAYAIRYIMDYFVEFVFFQKPDFSRVHVRITNVFVCYIILSMFINIF